MSTHDNNNDDKLITMAAAAVFFVVFLYGFVAICETIVNHYQ